MKNVISLMAILLATVSFAFAQQMTFVPYEGGDYTKGVNADEKAGAAFDQPGTNAMEWNYGNIENASTGYRFFKFTNTGNAPLVISAAKGSCGCTVPSYPKEPIMPGQSEFIKVKYDTKRTGAMTKYVTLTTNSVDNATTRLKIFGTVAPPANAPAAPANNGKTVK
jgi:hypothetical protein